MRANALLRPLCAALSVAFTLSAQANPACVSPVELGNKPSLRDFGDYSEFLVTVMAHKAKEEEQTKHRQLCPELYQPAPVVEAPTAENLDQAVAATREQPPFDYSSNNTWYNRSTSRSFGLAGMPNNQMSGEAIQTPLALLDQPPLSEQDRNNSLALLAPVEDVRTGAILPGQQASQEYQQQLIAREQLTQAFGLERWITSPNSGLTAPGINLPPPYTSAEEYQQKDPQGYQNAVKEWSLQRGLTYQPSSISNQPPTWDSVTISPDGNLVVFYHNGEATRTHTTIYYSSCWSSCYGK